MASIQISELTPKSLIELNSSEIEAVFGGRRGGRGWGHGRGRGRGRVWNSFFNSLNTQQATNISLVVQIGDGNTAYVYQSASNTIG